MRRKRQTDSMEGVVYTGTVTSIIRFKLFPNNNKKHVKIAIHFQFLTSLKGRVGDLVNFFFVMLVESLFTS